MKKVILIVFLILVGFTINTGFVSAETTSGINTQTDPRFQNNESFSAADCGLFGNPESPNDFAYYLQKTFDVIRFLGPILVVLMTIIDLVKATSESNQDGEIKKVGIKALKRIIYAVILFVLPTLINIFFGLIGLYGTCNIS